MPVRNYLSSQLFAELPLLSGLVAPEELGDKSLEQLLNSNVGSQRPKANHHCSTLQIQYEIPGRGQKVVVVMIMIKVVMKMVMIKKDDH